MENLPTLPKSQDLVEPDLLEDKLESIALDYNDILGLAENYRKFGLLFHGTSAKNLSRQVLPPNETQIISEKGRNINLDRVFFTSDYKSAVIYSKRASKSYGGDPRVLKVVPVGEVTTLNANRGTTVFHAPKAIVLSKRLERILNDITLEA